ncbi:MAG: hypothetical protein AAB654_26005 [Acidobacteriota bacterium]
MFIAFISHALRFFNHQFHLTLFRLDRHRLFAHPPHHVKWRLRPAVQRQLPHVRRDPFSHLRAHRLLDPVKPVRRAQTLDPLVRPLMIIILHPPPDPLPRFLEGREPRPAQELLPDRLPEPLDLPQRLRMVRAAADMLDPVPFQFLLELGLAVPARILPPVIRQHLPGHPVGAHSPPEHLQQIIPRLAPEDLQGRDVPGMIVDESDQVGISPGAQPFRRPDRFPAQLEGKDVALPHLVGCRALEKARLGWVARGPLLAGRDQLLPVQRFTHRLRACRQVE